MRMIKYSVLAVAIFGLVFLPYVKGDNDTNDSLDNAETLGNGTSSGSVSTDWVEGDDEDYYSLSIPALSKAIIKFKLVSGDSLSVDLFDEEKEEISEYIYLTSSGETETYERWNKNSESTVIYIGLSGECTYQIEISFEELDNDDSIETSKPISSGDTNGEVSYDYEHYEDVDFHSISIPTGNILTVKVTMIDGSSITVDGYDSDSSELDSFSMFLSDEGEMETEYIKNNDKSDETIYISISGKGTYKISIAFEAGDNNDSLDDAEKLIAGTIIGEVSNDYDYPKDEDYYVITVPNYATLTVVAKFEEGNDEYSTITVQGYDHFKVEQNIFEGIWMYLENPGETDVSNWRNSDVTEKDVYLGITGDGKYKLTIEIDNPISDDDVTPDDDDGTPIDDDVTPDDDDDIEPIPHDEANDSSCGSIMIGSIISLLILITLVFGFVKKRS